ncbi:protoporphyrinogen oxidase [Angustibacter peucedani]
MRVVVVGAGIAGLAAAWELVQHDPVAAADLEVVVLDAAPRVGGKLVVGEVGGVTVDLGAESLLARRPEALELAREVGLADDLVTPRPVGAALWSAGDLHPLPAGTLMGVPSSTTGLAGLLDDDGLAAVSREPEQVWAPVEADDVAVADLVARRVGAGVVDRLVEPLLGGVYAGRAAALSLRATVPALWDAAVRGRSLVETARGAAERGTSTQGPVFAGVRGGVGRLPLAAAAAVRERGGRVRTGTTVRSLARTSSGWRLVTGPTTDEVVLDADAVVLATPAAPTARLLRDVAPAAARALGEVEHASVALVTFVLDRTTATGLTGSGVLVPPVDGRYAKAATFSSTKWGWVDDAATDRVVVRASVGRHGGIEDLQLPDDEVARRVLADLRELPGVTLSDPLEVQVTRWGGGLPQYAVGHLDRVARALADVERHPGLALAGAAYEGVGIPACVASGRRAASAVIADLAVRGG